LEEVAVLTDCKVLIEVGNNIFMIVGILDPQIRPHRICLRNFNIIIKLLNCILLKYYYVMNIPTEGRIRSLFVSSKHNYSRKFL